MMKKILAQGILAIPVWFMLGSVSFGMCIWFAPPSRQFAPASNMKTLISRQGDQLTMTVQPQFSGDATNFALVMPFPSEPTVTEAPESVFTELEDLTNPEVAFDDFVGINTALEGDTSTERSELRIIEERDVGDFSTVTLSASSETALIEWLDKEGYDVPDAKKAVIANYVMSDGYFVALKVNMDKAEVDADGFLQGELKPISFEFQSAETVIPLQLMAGESSLVTLTIYTLGESLTYVPGAEIQFSKKVDASHLKEAPSLENYNAWKRWLVRNVIQVETSEIKSDLTLLTTSDTRVVVPGEEPLILNPDLLPKETGVLVSENGQTIYTDEDQTVPVPAAERATSKLTTAMVVILAISNVVLLTILVSNKNSVKATRRR